MSDDELDNVLSQLVHAEARRLGIPSRRHARLPPFTLGIAATVFILATAAALYLQSASNSKQLAGAIEKINAVAEENKRLQTVVTTVVAENDQLKGKSKATQAIAIRLEDDRNSSDPHALQLVTYFDSYPNGHQEQIKVETRKSGDDADAPHLAYTFKFKGPADWMAASLLIREARQDGKSVALATGPEKDSAIDIPALLKLSDDDWVKIKFSLRGKMGGELVEVQSGGDKSGILPRKLSLRSIALSTHFEEHAIEMPARLLKTLSETLSIMARADENAGADKIEFEAANLLIERTDTPWPIAGRVALSNESRALLLNTLWFDYSPSGFAPTQPRVRPPSEQNVRADLAVYAQMLAATQRSKAGIILYGCSNLQDVPRLAREQNLAVILGIWDPRDEKEIAQAEALLRDESLAETIVACCIGNETQQRREPFTLDKIRETAARLRKARDIPMTSTEIVKNYGFRELADSFNFCFPTVQSLFELHSADPDAAAAWTIEQIKRLRAAAPTQVIIVKENGMPAAPGPMFSEENQARYWAAILKNPIANEINFAVFDGAFRTDWKHEMVSIDGRKEVEVGPHWSLFNPDRQPRKAMTPVLEWWKNRKPVK